MATSDMTSKLRYLKLLGIPGLTSVTDPALVFAEVVKVNRESRIMFLTNRAPDLPQPAPGSGEAYFDSTTGTIDFDASNPLSQNISAGGFPNFQLLEKIHILYKQSIA